MSSLLTKWRKEQDTIFLSETSRVAQAQKLRDLDRAIWDALNKKSSKRFPRFKKKGRHDSFRISGTKEFSIDMNNSKVRIPKIGWVPFRKSRDITGTPKNITISKHAGKWFVSIQTEYEIPDPVHPAKEVVGIDMGIKRFATLSDGTVIKPLNSFPKSERKLAKEQRKLSRKKRFSQNWKKQQRKVANIYYKIANVRRDFLHKASTAIANKNHVVIIEDLKVSNMSKSTKGTKANPGKNVKAKSGLNKSILDQGWYEFRRQLAYKLEWQGGQLIAVDPKHTSQRCSKCGHTAKENRLSQAKFVCTHCSFSCNADLNAARNIVAVGQTVIAYGDIHSGTRVAQESVSAN